jgi:hypothetical protein
MVGTGFVWDHHLLEQIKNESLLERTGRPRPARPDTAGCFVLIVQNTKNLPRNHLHKQRQASGIRNV